MTLRKILFRKCLTCNYDYICSMQEKQAKPEIEFIALMASLMSIVALSIDALLPALSQIGIAVNNLNTTDNQLLITMIFLGLGVGQLIFGPLSDSFGRKPIVMFGFAVFAIASFICVAATSLEMMVVGRILQGVGLSAPRSISISIIRDSYKGDYMARVMSFVTALFILIPVVAPALGKFLLDNYNWQTIFYVQLGFGVLVAIWFWLRQPETLKEEHKVKFDKHIFINGIKEVLKHKETIGFTIISGFITGSFMVFLSASQHIFEVQYNLVEEFPYIFAGMAIAVGSSTFLNGTLVVRLGMRRLAFIALILFCCVSITYSFLFWSTANPSLWTLVVFMALQFFTLGFLFGNLRAIAMEPIGHIAGIGSAITGFLSTLMAVPMATYIGGFVKNTALPLFIGFAICGCLGLMMFLWMKKVRRNKR